LVCSSLPFETDPEAVDLTWFGFGKWELALLIGIPIAVGILFVMILFSVRHQRRRRMINRRMVDMEHNMDSADIPILGWVGVGWVFGRRDGNSSIISFVSQDTTA
jgi:hypothetical protein